MKKYLVLLLIVLETFLLTSCVEDKKIEKENNLKEMLTNSINSAGVYDIYNKIIVEKENRKYEVDVKLNGNKVGNGLLPSMFEFDDIKAEFNVNFYENNNLNTEESFKITYIHNSNGTYALEETALGTRKFYSNQYDTLIVWLYYDMFFIRDILENKNLFTNFDLSYPKRYIRCSTSLNDLDEDFDSLYEVRWDKNVKTNYVDIVYDNKVNEDLHVYHAFHMETTNLEEHTYDLTFYEPFTNLRHQSINVEVTFNNLYFKYEKTDPPYL